MMTLDNEADVVELYDGLLEKKTDYTVEVSRLNNTKTVGKVFNDDKGLDLENIDQRTISKYLPLVHKIIEGMDQVETLHVHLSDFNSREMLLSLQKRSSTIRILKEYFLTVTIKELLAIVSLMVLYLLS
jgi:hypothetical protein